jgi:hypothetical protein
VAAGQVWLAEDSFFEENSRGGPYWFFIILTKRYVK